MKKTMFIIAFTYFNTLIFAQNLMKEKTFLNFKYFELSDKEKEKVLKDVVGFEKIERGRDFVYKLSNGKVLFELKGLTNFLFESEADCNSFLDTTSKPQKVGNMLFTYTHPIEDTAFIENTEMYITFFAGEQGIEVDLTDTLLLRNVDQLLNRIPNQEVKRFRLSIIALIGEYIVANFKGAEWKYFHLMNPQKEIAPVILVNGKTLIGPATILYEEFNKREKNAKYKININGQVDKLMKGFARRQ